MRHLLVITCCLLFGFRQPAAQLATPQSPGAKTELRCYVTLDATLISQMTPAHARVEVENRSSARKTITGMTVYLEKQVQPKSDFTGPAEYYAPVDVVNGSALLPRYTRTRDTIYPHREVVLEASKEMTLSLDIKELLWARDISSLLPHARLLSAVPDGKYVLYVKVLAADGETAQSGKTEVTIARNGQVTHPKP